MRRSPSGGISSGNCSTVTRPAGAAKVISGAFEGRIVIVSCSASGGTHSSNDSEVTLSSARTEKAAFRPHPAILEKAHRLAQRHDPALRVDAGGMRLPVHPRQKIRTDRHG